MYIDIGGKSQIKSLTNPGEICELEYFNRGWSNANSFRVEGRILNDKK